MSVTRYLPKDTEAVAATLLWHPERGIYRESALTRRVEFILGEKLPEEVGETRLFELLARLLDYLNAKSYADRYSEPIDCAYGEFITPKKPLPYAMSQAKRSIQDFGLAGGWVYQASDVLDERSRASVDRIREALNAIAWSILQTEASEAEARQWGQR